MRPPCGRTGTIFHLVIHRLDRDRKGYTWNKTSWNELFRPQVPASMEAERTEAVENNGTPPRCTSIPCLHTLLDNVEQKPQRAPSTIKNRLLSNPKLTLDAGRSYGMM